MIRYSIDEFTLVFLPTGGNIDIEKWHFRFNELAIKIVEVLKFKELGLTRVNDRQAPIPYNLGYFYGDSYVCIACHNLRPVMGVCLKFSASGLRDYVLRYKKCFHCDISVPDILRLLESNVRDYSCRLSRIDFDADLLNEKVVVNDLARGLNDKTIILKDDRGYKNNSSINTISNDGIVNTAYIGSRVSKSRKFFRIYNKKEEQLNNSLPSFYKLAEDCRDWVRIELVLRHELAHKATDLLLSQSNDGLAGLIATFISNSLHFWKDDCELAFSKKIAHDSSSGHGKLLTVDTRQYSLKKSYDYFLYGSSGLQSFLFKLKEVEGEESVKQFLQKALDYQLNSFKPSKDLKKWLAHYKRIKML